MSRVIVLCKGKRYQVVVRTFKHRDHAHLVGECKLNGETWVCHPNNDGTWKAVGRKAVPLGRRA